MEPLIDRLLPLAGAGGLIAVAIVWAAWLWHRDRRQDRETGSTQVLGHIMERLTLVEQLNEKLREELVSARAQIAELRQQVVMLESAHQDLPLPQWLKDEHGIILAVNRAYVEMFLAPRGYTQFDYVGRDDYAVWPKDIADGFRANDAEVWRSGRVFNDEETVEMAGGERHAFHIIKYTRFAGGQRIGIAGIAVPPISVLKELSL